MIPPRLHPQSAADARERYRQLDLMEEDLKRRIAHDQTSLAGVRELKRQIQQQIFNTGAEPIVADRQVNAITTSTHNGPTTD